MVHLHSGILCSREQEGAYTLCNGMDGTGEHYAKCTFHFIDFSLNPTDTFRLFPWPRHKACKFHSPPVCLPPLGLSCGKTDGLPLTIPFWTTSLSP